jgi:hypothetical protein
MLTVKSNEIIICDEYICTYSEIISVLGLRYDSQHYGVYV